MTHDIAFTSPHDGSEQRYVLVLPEPFDADAPHDALIALHGHGSDRWQFVNDPRDECRAARDAASAHGMLYVSPDYRAKTSWMGLAAEADVVRIVEELRERHGVRRIVVCGASMGGAASLAFAALRPDLADAVVSMNGTANFVEYVAFANPLPEIPAAIVASFGGSPEDVPDEYRRRSAELCPERLAMPVALVTSGQDALVPPGSVLRLAEKLRSMGRDPFVIHREDRGHFTDYADARAAIEWAAERARKITGT